MKKILTFTLTLVLVLAVNTLNGQESSAGQNTASHGKWIGGGVTFGNLSGRDFTFAPEFGMLLRDNIGVGGTLYLSSGDNSNAWNVQPYFRYYIPVADKVSFYGDAFLGVGGGDFNTEVDGGDYSTLDFGIRAGIQYWFAQRWSITASNNVLVYNSTDGSGDFGMGIDFNSFNLAFFYHF